MMRASRSSSADASAFLEEPAVKVLSLYLRDLGYVLTPRARVFEWKSGLRSVRLVWRHPARRPARSVVLSVTL
jgi:hypothetical protein